MHAWLHHVLHACWRQWAAAARVRPGGAPADFEPAEAEQLVRELRGQLEEAQREHARQRAEVRWLPPLISVDLVLRTSPRALMASASCTRRSARSTRTSRTR